LLNPDEITKDAPPMLRRVQFVGYITFFALMAVLAGQVTRSYSELGNPWLVVLVAIAGYLAADLASGIVHFLADNFGSPDTPFLGQGFVLPFRQHHVDPLGITRHGFFAANGNNALVCLPVLIPVVAFVPVTTSTVGYASGVFTFVMLFAVFLTNQTHKWAHMEVVPRPIRWLQDAGIILSKSHHDIHHKSPFNTHYCITVGAWNSLFERLGLFDRLERLLRRSFPALDPRTRVEQDALTAAPAATSAPRTVGTPPTRMAGTPTTK
jgi:plasmanylethanolamine desaturase